MPFLSGVATPQDYGAVGDGSTDDTAAIQAAINGVRADGGGILFFPAATYAVTPVSSTSAALVLNNGTTGYNGIRLVGAGSGASTLKKLAVGPIISMSGPATDTTGVTHCKYCSLENIKLDGSSLSGTMVQLYYADNLVFDDVHATGNADIVFDTTEFWDSRFYDLVVESSGSTTANAQTPNMLLRNSATASAFGHSADNVNQIHFVGCRWEGAKTGSVWIQQGVSNSNNPNGLYFVNCKMETSALNGGPHLLADSSCKSIYVDNLYCYSGGFTGGYSTAQDVITWSAQDSALENVFIATGAAQTVANGLTLNSAVAGQTSSATGVTAIYNGMPTGQHIALGTATGNFAVNNCNSNQTPPTTLNAANTSVQSSSSNSILGSLVGGDTFKRYQLNANGTMLFGPGSGAADNQFNRASSTTMALSKNLVVGGTAALGDNGVGELQMTNATTPPSTNPTGGALIYASAGQLLSRNPQGLVGSLGSAQSGTTATTTVTASTVGTTETALSPSFTIPAADAVIGATYAIFAWGYMTTSATPPTITIRARIGGTGGTAIGTTGALTPTASLTNSGFWRLECYLTCVTTGASGTWTGMISLLDGFSTVMSTANNVEVTVPTVTRDTTVSSALLYTVTYSANTAGNSIVCSGGFAERVA